MKIGIGSYDLHFVRESDKKNYPIRGNEQKRDLYQVGKITKDAGFDCIELTLDEPFLRLSGYEGDDILGEIKRIQEYYEEIGLFVDKIHAGYLVGDRKNFDWKNLQNETLYDIEKAATVKAKYIVVHSDVYTCNYGEYNSDDAFKTAYEFLSPIVEKAKKLGVGVAVENLFEEGQSGSDRLRFSSKSEELIRIIDSFNDPIVSCCWDFGHAAAAFGDGMLNEMKKLGKRISCTHVHDNNCISAPSVHLYNCMKDLHLPVFVGKLDWESHIKALKELEYDGEFTLEAAGLNYPEELLLENLKMMYKNTKYLVENY